MNALNLIRYYTSVSEHKQLESRKEWIHLQWIWYITVTKNI